MRLLQSSCRSLASLSQSLNPYSTGNEVVAKTSYTNQLGENVVLILILLEMRLLPFDKNGVSGTVYTVLILILLEMRLLQYRKLFLVLSIIVLILILLEMRLLLLLMELFTL